ncbi:MAG TPA: YbjQ family protein [Candidatus Krumholzibacteria bacterium]|nr:YbjQ family protein [Candidatus Krumholzibacteria bacterium]
MIVVTTNEVPGHRVTQVFGLVQGSSVRARHLGTDILAFFKNITGGEILQYTKLLAEAREQALDRMREEAVKHGANAVVGLRFSSTDISEGASELLVYGTAVQVERS